MFEGAKILNFKLHHIISAFTFQLTDMPYSTENLKLDNKAEYEAVHGVPNTAAPKVFMKYFFVNSKTGEKSGEMLATVKLKRISPCQQTNIRLAGSASSSSVRS